jgi:hypothetical protein
LLPITYLHWPQLLHEESHVPSAMGTTLALRAGRELICVGKSIGSSIWSCSRLRHVRCSSPVLGHFLAKNKFSACAARRGKPASGADLRPWRSVRESCAPTLQYPPKRSRGGSFKITALKRKSRSVRNLPCRTSSSSLRFVAAITAHVDANILRAAYRTSVLLLPGAEALPAPFLLWHSFPF